MNDDTTDGAARRTAGGRRASDRPARKRPARKRPATEPLGGQKSTPAVDPQPAETAQPGAPEPTEPHGAPDITGQRAEVGAEVRAHLATPDELADWDAQAVASKNGHVYQSRAWGDYRASRGWQAWHIAFDDGFRLLAVGRERAVVGGGGAYATRGPIPEDDPALSARRAAAAAELLAGQGMDAFTVDGETPASSGLHGHLEARGFELTEELQPSRHRMDVHLGPVDTPNSDESTIFGSFGATTRNLIRQAERRGLRVQRLDAGGGRADDDRIGVPLEGFDPVDLADAATTDEMLRTFYGMLDATAHRRGFALASEEAFTDWSTRSLAAGHMLYLQARDEEDGPVAGASFYRHGDRLTYSLAGDRAELRKKHPGAVRLLVWRGIQIALDERRAIVDLGGIDTEGAREQPNKGDPTYGMYQFKESFGARWVELTGAHQRTMRPMSNLARRVIGKLAALRRRRR